MITFKTQLNENELSEWASFVQNHPDGTIFQTPAYYNSITRTGQVGCFSFFAVQNEKIVGVIITEIKRERGSLIGVLSSRALVTGAPLVLDRNPVIAEELIRNFNYLLSGKAVLSQFRNLSNQESLRHVFFRNGFVFKEHLNIIINLEKSEEELWKDVHHKRRNEIRRARKENTIFELVDHSTAIEDTYYIIQEVYKRARLPLPTLDYFKIIYETIDPSVFKIFVAKYEGKIIGTMYTLCFKNTIYDWYAGALRFFYGKYPNDLIPWEVFLWGKRNGFMRFDFGGAGIPTKRYGVRDYKKKFGGDLVAYGRYERINKPLIFKISKAGFYLWKTIRGLRL